MSWKTKFFIITAGQMASMIGSSAVQFSLIWWIASETDSAFMLGMSGLVAFIPMTLLSPAAGIAADRYSRKTICILSDIFTGLVAAVFAYFMWSHGAPVWSALIILFLRGISGTFQQPAIQALTPQYVPEDYLVKAGGWNQMLTSGSFMLGPVIGAAMYAALPLPVILLTDLVGALIASGLLAIVKIPPLERKTKEKPSALTELKEGIDVFRQDKRLLLILIVQTICMVFYMPLSSFYPLMTSSYFDLSAWHGSIVEAAYAIGMLLSAMLFGSVLKVKRHLNVAYFGLFGMGIASAVCGALPPYLWAWWVFMIFCAIMGGFGNVHSIPLVAYMQTTIAPEKMGRAFSVMALLGSVTMPIGLLIASPIADVVGVHIWFLVTGIGVLLATLAGFIIHRRMD